jgi:SsrA-binding protein
MSVLISNKKTKFDYFILETYQAGLVLPGQMVKLIRSRRITLSATFIINQNNRLELINLGNETMRLNVPILLRKKEMKEITVKLNQKGISCVALNIKTVGRWLKAEIALVKGKKNYDKRQTLKNRDIERDLSRGIS